MFTTVLIRSSCFNQILLFLQDQEDKVFLKRFLRRQEIEDEIRRCDRSLDDAFKVLDVSGVV